jgi:hypothetical protein
MLVTLQLVTASTGCHMDKLLPYCWHGIVWSVDRQPRHSALFLVISTAEINGTKRCMGGQWTQGQPPVSPDQGSSPQERWTSPGTQGNTPTL